MEIQRTRMEELDLVMEVYDRARAYMRQNGNLNQWIKGYPSRALVEEDIQRGVGYVCREGEALLAAFAFIPGEDPSYREIRGGWLGKGPYGALHRLGVAQSRGGVGSFCINWCLERCGDLRLDTHRDNIPMQNMLKKLGFTPCGVITIEDGSERLAFERILRG